MATRVDAVMAIEAGVYPFPWTPRQLHRFARRGLRRAVLRDAASALLGYFVAMHGVDEMHLLNITVAPAHQRQGHARCMLDALVERCRRGARAPDVARGACQQQRGARDVPALWLSRASDVRRGYYPARARQARETQW